MVSGIYQIKNQVNGNCYIGSAVNLRQRWAQHLSALRHNAHHNSHLQAAFNRYGETAFVFSGLKHTEPERLIECEQHYLDTLKPAYNMAAIAGSSLGCQRSLQTCRRIGAASKGRQHSAETRQKMSEAMSGEQNPFYGKHHSGESRRRMSEAHMGQRVSQEARRKISKALKGRQVSEEHRAKLSEALMGHEVSEYTRQRVGEANRRRHVSMETRQKMSMAAKAYWRRFHAAEVEATPA